MGENEGNEYRVRGKKMGEKALLFSFLLRWAFGGRERERERKRMREKEMKTTTKTNRSLTLKLINVIQNFTQVSFFFPSFPFSLHASISFIYSSLSIFLLSLFQFFFLFISHSKKCAAQMDLKIYISIFHIKCSLHFTSFLYRKEMEKKQKRRKENEEERRKKWCGDRDSCPLPLLSAPPVVFFLSLSLPTTFTSIIFSTRKNSTLSLSYIFFLYLALSHRHSKEEQQQGYTLTQGEDGEI